jgi:ketosteroid isomerase-like protein
MSQENVKVVQAVIEAWNAGDMDAAAEHVHPNVVGWAPEDWPEPGPFVGREAVMRQLRQMREAWDVDTLEPIGDFVDAGDRVAVRVIWHVAGHGPETNLEMTDIFMVRKRKIFGIETCWDHAEALEYLGLSE